MARGGAVGKDVDVHHDLRHVPRGIHAEWFIAEGRSKAHAALRLRRKRPSDSVGRAARSRSLMSPAAQRPGQLRPASTTQGGLGSQGTPRDKLQIQDSGVGSAAGPEVSGHTLGPGDLASMWGVLGVMAFLFNGMRRVVPVALQPFGTGLTAGGWVAYMSSVLFFAYAEGYRGFQLRFSPMVVRRALLLSGERAPRLHQVMAPAYSMAFFHAKPRRKAMSYGLVVGIFAIVALVKRLPYPWRSILDAGPRPTPPAPGGRCRRGAAGVCVGLSWGISATGLIFLRALRTGQAPNVDPCLPDV
ncbi:unnamed protein product [Prorocentrum cordatum]|uniref:Uncharacterized protein n=1 Tax=Prorocentrum cordatum TaxID=2364126 RepID=A0ABN9U712_9DINO|nr:unnamed protein product [Polarella glacialis]